MGEGRGTRWEMSKIEMVQQCIEKKKRA